MIFIEELQCHNDYHKPITKDRYELFLRKLNQKMMSEAYNINQKSRKIIPIIFFQCIARQKMLPNWSTVTKNNPMFKDHNIGVPNPFNSGTKHKNFKNLYSSSKNCVEL